MDEVRLDEEWLVRQDLRWRAICEDLPVFSDDDDAVGDDRDDLEVVSCNDSGSPGSAKLLDEIDEYPLAPRVEAGCWFVKQQDRWFEGEHRGNSGALFLAAREFERRPVSQVQDIHLDKCSFDAGPYFAQGKAELKRSESNIITNGGGEELDIRVLEDETNFAMELVFF